MAYGIRFETANGEVQIDSETTGTGFLVTSSGTSETLALPAAGSDTITFARPSNQPVTTTTTIAYQVLGAAGFTPGFYDRDGNAVECDWIRGMWFNDASITPSTGYGIQIYNSDGDLAFDSGQFNGNGGFGVTNYVSSGTITVPPNNDANEGVSTGTVISTDLSAYYDMSNTGRITGFTEIYAGYVFRPATGVHWVSYTVQPGFPPFGTDTTDYGTNPTIFYGTAGSV